MSKKLNQKEGIAVGVSLLVVAVFVSMVFSFNTDSVEGFSVSPYVDSKGEPFDYITPQTILDFDSTDLIEGDGTVAGFGDTLYVHYVGQLDNGDIFDTSTYKERPLEVTLGVGEVITGWELGLIGMREGGTRRLIIPSGLAYGPKGVVSATGVTIVPQNATLLFDIVLLHVKKDQ